VNTDLEEAKQSLFFSDK